METFFEASDDWYNIIKSLAPIQPAAYKCFFTNGRDLSKQLQAGAITEKQVPTLLMAKCGRFMSQIVQIQNATASALAPWCTTVRTMYQNLPDSAKNTLKMIEQLGNDTKTNPELKNNKTAVCARVHDILQSIRSYSDADRNQIALAIPQSAHVILPNGTCYANFSKYLDMADSRCTGNLTDAEKQQMAAYSASYHLHVREQLVPFLENLTMKLEAAQVSDKVSNDPVINNLANKIATAIVDDFNKQIKTNDFKTKLNKAIEKSNQLKASAATLQASASAAPVPASA